MVCIPQVAITKATLDDDLYNYIPHHSVQIVQIAMVMSIVHRLKGKYNYHDKGVIIIDVLKTHENLLENIDAEAEKIVFYLLVAHSSHQTQPLDISLFEIMKR